MEYVDAYKLFGAVTKQIPNIIDEGPPTIYTEGAVGCMYMDTDTGELYKCTAAANGAYTWKAVGGGGSAPHTNTHTDEEYYEIDLNGIISLKPEYRGDTTAEYAGYFKFSISDNGPEVEGSRIDELPEIIIIPNIIDGIEVTGFQEGIFCCNKRVKEITIPSTIKAIPKGFVVGAIHFEKLINTEQIEVIGNSAFRQTRIKELICPNLMDGSFGAYVFKDDYCLQRVDLGNITAIPRNTFEYCANLSEVKADNVTEIREYAFFGTRRLKTLAFQANVTEIREAAFWNSRCDLEALPPNCTFGTMACYKSKDFNTPDNDYWAGVPYTACKRPLGSIFYQKDPEWATKPIKYTDTNGKVWEYFDQYGNPCTYGSNGCGLFVLIEIYSALMGEPFEKPWEIFPILESKSTEEVNLLEKDFRTIIGWREMAEGLDLQVTQFTTMTAANLREIYDALAGGEVLLRKSVAGKYDSDAPYCHGGHVVVGYGINADGEMLISDTSMHCNEVGIFENHKTAWHIQKQAGVSCNCMIVSKKKQKEE